MSSLPSGSSAHPAHQIQQPHLTDTDPLVKYQTLLPILKESVNVRIYFTSTSAAFGCF